MNTKRIMKALAVLVTLCSILLNSTQSFALYLKGHGYGETYKAVTGEDCIALTNASVDAQAGTVTIADGGHAVFGFYVPYGMSGVTLIYEEAAGVVSINMGERVYQTEALSGSGEYYLNFGDYLGIADQYFDYNNANQNGYYRDFLEHRGEYEVTVESQGGIALSELRFERELIPATTTREMDISPEARATLSTVLIDTDSPVLVVNGATRYVDVNDTESLPYNYRGRLYLPLNTLAKALGYYHEDYPEKGYALMRGDQNEVVLLEGRCTLTIGVNDPVEIEDAAIVYRNGKAYGAVRYFAELAGETVGYQDGLVVIDNKYTVEDVFTDEALHGHARSFFTPYEAEKADGRTYYVAQNARNASDSNSGSAAAPFKTIGKAAQVARAGDTVIVCEGVYREELVPKWSGTAVSPVTYKAKEGDKVVISANEVLGTWTQEGSSNVWKTPMDWDLGTTRNQIFIDGKPLNEARYPNGPEILNNTELLDNTWPVKGDLWRPTGTDNTNVVRSSTLLWQEEEDYWAGGIFVGMFGHMYSYMTARIESSSKGELTLKSDEKSAPWYTNTNSMDHGYIVGHRNCLDAPGEWIYEDGYLYMIFPEGATPNETVVEAKARQRVIDLNNRKYINIIGFETIGGSARTKGAKMCMLNGLDMKYISHFIHIAHAYRGGIDFPYDNMDENGSVERGENGIYLSGTNDMVVNCRFDHSAGAGIYMTGLYSYVENNIMNDCGYACVQNAGCYIAGRPYESRSKLRGGHSFYNNTIYNVGRSAMIISSADKSGYAYMPFLPIETAYNDIHGAFLDASDVGATYEYTVQLDIDGYDSELHHNYIYVDEQIAPGDESPKYCLIYHDEGSRGYTTYDNQLFTSDVGLVPSIGFTYQNRGQNSDNVAAGTTNSSEAYSRMWNNSGHIVPGGSTALHEGYFAEERPFYAGAMRDYKTLEAIDYTRNYERYKAGIFNMKYRAMDAELSEGVTIDSKTGYARFTASGQYIHFKDVEFPEKTETLAITFHGDSQHTQDNIEIIIGESMESGIVYRETVEAEALDTFDVDRVAYTINDISGIHDVWIKVTDYKSIEIGGIGVYDIIDPVVTDPAYSAFVWAGDFSSNGKVAKPSTTVKPITLTAQGYGKKLLSDAYPGNYVKYEDVTLSMPADEFTMSARSGDAEGQLIQVYVESADSEGFGENAAASFNIEGKSWSTHKQYVPLNADIPAGTYDIYIVFATEGGKGKVCTVVNWGFKAKDAVLAEFSDAKVRQYAGEYDTALSVENSSYPFCKAKLEAPQDTSSYGLTYTLPGTVAGYSDVTLKETASELVVRYAAEDYLDGQTVEVRVGSPESEPVASFVTAGTGYRNLKTQEIALKAPIPAGTYNVYFTFKDDGSGDIKTCNFSWFGFN